MFLRTQSPSFEVRLADGPADIAAVQRLRYRVFVQECGADGPQVDHLAQREADMFDAHFDHLLLIDPARPVEDRVVGTYRMMTRAQAERAGGFYSAAEYDLTRLTDGKASILELGRSCLHPDYRGGTALLHLWRGVGDYVATEAIDILFGVASFPGTTPGRHAQSLSLLHQMHLAPQHLRVTARGEGATPMDLVPPEKLDRRAAMVGMPALIKAYLRLGGVVGDGAYVDRAFNTTDVCLILQADLLTARQKAFYGTADGG